MTGRMRVRHDHDRQAESRHLGERGRPGAPDDEVGGGQRGQHVVAQERERAIAIALLGGQRLATGQRGGVAVVTGDVDDGHPLDQSGQRLGDGAR